MKNSLKGEWENLHGKVEAWASRWAATHAQLAQARPADYAELLQRGRAALAAADHCDDLLRERDRIM